MATASTASRAQSLRERAAAIRLAKQGTQAPQKDEGVFAAVGYAGADFINGFATARDAYTVRRAER